jgi:hypothetical protein
MIAWEKAVLSSSDLKELWLGLAPGMRFYLYHKGGDWTGEAWELGGGGCKLKATGSKEELITKLDKLLGIQCDL